MSETDSPEDVQRRIDLAADDMLRFWLRLYKVYCSWQAHFRSEEIVPLATAEELASEVEDLRRWGIIGPTTHLLLFAVSATLSTFTPWGFALYIGYSAVFANVVMLWLLLRYRTE